jgi:hypothetical protein
MGGGDYSRQRQKIRETEWKQYLQCSNFTSVTERWYIRLRSSLRMIDLHRGGTVIPGPMATVTASAARDMPGSPMIGRL